MKEIRRENSKIIQENGDSFNNVEETAIISPITLDKRLIRGQISSGKLNSEDNEPDYSADILDNGKYNIINIF